MGLPSSFARGDGRQLHGTGAGETKEEASEKACRHAMAQLLVSDASRVVLRPRHWDIAPSALVAGLPGVGAKHQALPAHVAARSSEASVEAAVGEPNEAPLPPQPNAVEALSDGRGLRARGAGDIAHPGAGAAWRSAPPPVARYAWSGYAARGP